MHVVVHQYECNDFQASPEMAYCNTIDASNEILFILEHPRKCSSVCTDVEISGILLSLHIFPPISIPVNRIPAAHLVEYQTPTCELSEAISSTKFAKEIKICNNSAVFFC